MAFVNPAEWAEWYARRWPRKAAQYIARHADSTDPIEIARAAFLKVILPASGRCWMCGTPLEDETSKAAGIGPSCAAKLAARAAS